LIILVTFLVFRFGIVAYMSIWLIMNRSLVPFSLCFIGHSGLLIMTIINCHLIYRLLKSDFSVKYNWCVICVILFVFFSIKKKHSFLPCIRKKNLRYYLHEYFEKQIEIRKFVFFFHVYLWNKRNQRIKLIKKKKRNENPQRFAFK